MTLFFASAVLSLGTWYWGSVDRRGVPTTPWTLAWVMHNAMLPLAGASALLALGFVLVCAFNGGLTGTGRVLAALSPFCLLVAIAALVTRTRLGRA